MANKLMKSRYRYLIPNGITLVSLSCGVFSILLAAQEAIYLAGVLIVASYVLDLFDGAMARRLHATTEFGLQLDSLVDMVSLGTAPAILVFMHLQVEGVSTPWIWPSVILFPIAGAFRLARFNLLPPKASGRKDSAGLTITAGGSALALAVLSDLVLTGEALPDWGFLPLTVAVSLLMASTIPFPSFLGVFAERRQSLILIILFILSLFVTTFFSAWFFWTVAYLGISLARASYQRWRSPQS